MKTESTGSVRVDLLGGTLDLSPINLILPEVITINLATSLKASAIIEKADIAGVEIVSIDYGTSQVFTSQDFSPEKFSNGFFGPLNFVAQILFELKFISGAKITLKSGSPAGAGLGGSSTMGMTLYKGIRKFQNQDLDQKHALTVIKGIEAKCLDAGPTGYQDYYPALYGGVLALKANVGGVIVEQLFDDELKSVLENHLTLVYSGITRNSGINNWEVYKSFFDDKGDVRAGLEKIAKLSYEAYQAILDRNWSKFIHSIKLEGAIREKLFPGIVCIEVKSLFLELQKKYSGLGLKVCGAGGGGCFLIIHDADAGKKVKEMIRTKGMSVLDFHVEAPL